MYSGHSRHSTNADSGTFRAASAATPSLMRRPYGRRGPPPRARTGTRDPRTTVSRSPPGVPTRRPTRPGRSAVRATAGGGSDEDVAAVDLDDRPGAEAVAHQVEVRGRQVLGLADPAG